MDSNSVRDLAVCRRSGISDYAACWIFFNEIWYNSPSRYIADEPRFSWKYAQIQSPFTQGVSERLSVLSRIPHIST